MPRSRLLLLRSSIPLNRRSLVAEYLVAAFVTNADLELRLQELRPEAWREAVGTLLPHFHVRRNGVALHYLILEAICLLHLGGIRWHESRTGQTA